METAQQDDNVMEKLRDEICRLNKRNGLPVDHVNDNFIVIPMSDESLSGQPHPSFLEIDDRANRFISLYGKKYEWFVFMLSETSYVVRRDVYDLILLANGEGSVRMNTALATPFAHSSNEDSQREEFERLREDRKRKRTDDGPDMIREMGSLREDVRRIANETTAITGELKRTLDQMKEQAVNQVVDDTESRVCVICHRDKPLRKYTEKVKKIDKKTGEVSFRMQPRPQCHGCRSKKYKKPKKKKANVAVQEDGDC